MFSQPDLNIYFCLSPEESENRKYFQSQLEPVFTKRGTAKFLFASSCLHIFIIYISESASVTSKFARRTHTCSDLTEDRIGEEVHLCGWVELKRLGRFLTLRDGYGAAQLVAPSNVRITLTVRPVHHKVNSW